MSPTTFAPVTLDGLTKRFRAAEGTLPSAQDPSIQLAYVSVFPPPGTRVRGVVLFLHGVGEHYGRFFRLFESLCSQGFGVIAYELRSHGRSHMDVPGMKAHVSRFQEFIDDTNDVVGYATAELFPRMGVPKETPWIISGFSLGSLISLHTVLSRQHTFSSIVLLGPAIGAEMTVVLYVLTWFTSVLSALFPAARIVPAVNPDWICRDPVYLADFDADELTTRELLTCRTGAETLGAIIALESDDRVEQPNSFFSTIPILMVMGSNDKVTSQSKAQQFFSRIASHDKQFEIIDGAYHVLVDDYDRDLVLDKINQWLVQRFPL